MNGRPEDHGERTWRQEALHYLVGFALALALTLIPFWAVALSPLGRGAVLAVVGACALAQVAVQLRWFLHIDLTRQSREDLQLILFTALILAIMIGGTVWILTSQMARMV